ncbi:MAG: hypothetical protein WCG27_11710, partial [Pseudomonadota bacterium]
TLTHRENTAFVRGFIGPQAPEQSHFELKNTKQYRENGPMVVTQFYNTVTELLELVSEMPAATTKKK